MQSTMQERSFGSPLIEQIDTWESESTIDNLLVRIHVIIKMIKWTGLAPLEFEFPFPSSHTNTAGLHFLAHLHEHTHFLGT